MSVRYEQLTNFILGSNAQVRENAPPVSHLPLQFLVDASTKIVDDSSIAIRLNARGSTRSGVL